MNLNQSDDDLDLRLEDLWRRKAAAHRAYHPEPSDPDFDLENIQSRYDWIPGRNWMRAAPKRGQS
jgi:hypothetical protein